MLTVVKGHLAAACELLEISSPESPLQLPASFNKSSPGTQLEFVTSIATKVVEGYTVIGKAYILEVIKESNDGVSNYSRVLCHFGALVLEFLDAWAEGDVERIYLCWQLFLPHFLASGHTKYSLQALYLQFQVKAVLSPHLAHHVLWDHFVNSKGGIGRIILCDVHNEHVNKLLKEMMLNMGSNLTEEAIQKAARSVTAMKSICRNFDKASDVPFGTSAHSTRLDEQDVAKVVSVVIDRRLFSVLPGRTHSAFPRIRTNPLWNWNVGKMMMWIELKKRDFLGEL